MTATTTETRPAARPYRVLNELAPGAFLVPEDFRTEHDRDDYGAEQYARGLEISRESESVSIACNSTWTARPLAGGVCTSSEGIGYHANTADLLRGFLDGPAPLTVYRYAISQPAATEIKPHTSPA